MPCKDIILHARASSSGASGVRALAEVPLGHSEAGVQRVLQEYGCRIPVDMEYIDLPSQKQVPYVRFSQWVRFLGETGRLSYIVGTNDREKRRLLCLEFWNRFKRCRPHHPVFSMTHNLADVIPVLHHGDEGRCYKRQAVMIISTHGVLGQGSQQSEDGNKDNYPVHEDAMRLNFLGSSLCNHFIFAALPQVLYKGYPDALDTMLGLYGQDLQNLATAGIKLKVGDVDEHLRFVCLAVKGDLPYLAKAGHMARTFSMCPKHACATTNSKGICWMCLGGVEGRSEKYDWENFNLDAPWLLTRGVEPGFHDSGPLTVIPHDSEILFYRPDIWHCFHLGCAKTFAASSMVQLMQLTMDGSVEDKLRVLSADFRMFCKRTHRYAYVRAITRDLLGWEKSSDTAQGHWYKGHLTTRFLEWIEDLLARNYSASKDEFVQEIVPWLQLNTPCIDIRACCYVWAGGY